LLLTLPILEDLHLSPVPSTPLGFRPSPVQCITSKRVTRLSLNGAHTRFGSPLPNSFIGHNFRLLSSKTASVGGVTHFKCTSGTLSTWPINILVP
jgi:hypothetical protein